MKANRVNSLFASLWLACVFSQVSAQITETDNNITSVTSYVGCDNSSNQPLRFTTEANYPHIWRTANVQRMLLNGNVTSSMGPGATPPFTNVPRDGFLLLSGEPDAFTNAGCRAPFTRMHLIDDIGSTQPVVYAQEHGFRPWQRNGITFTGNSDQSYIGHKYEDGDETDFVIQWSDNPNGSPWGTDRMKFIFNTEYNPSSSRGAATVYGLEAMRLWPVDVNNVNVGIGDFNFAATDPSERLDVLSGRVRIRELPDDDECEVEYKVMVVDATGDPDERGVVKWVDPSVFTGGGSSDCDWLMDAPTNVMWTATATVSSTVDCPEEDWLVGIGTSQPDFKLHVRHDESVGALSGGIASVLVADPTGAPAGIYGEVVPNSGTLEQPVGVRGKVSEVTENGQGVYGEAWAASGTTTKIYGALGLAYGHAEGGLNQGYGAAGICQSPEGGTIEHATGVYGELQSYGATTNGAAVSAYAWGEGASTVRSAFDGSCYGGGASVETYGLRVVAKDATETNHGVSATAQGAGVTNYGVKAITPSTGATANFAVHAYAPNQQDSWAVWSEGRQYSSTSATWSTSDAMLKQNIEAYSGGLQKVLQLQPKSYQYQTSTYDYMSLPTGDQVGFIAQEVEAVLPDLVTEATRPAEQDSLGNEIAPETSFKVMQYGGLTPILVSAVQEMSASMAAMQSQITQLQEQLAACCTSPIDDGTRSTAGSATDEGSITPAQERLLRIAPNPFTDRTTLYCNLERGGRMQLIANSADGRDLIMLAEGQREAGGFQHVWSTEQLAPGVYYVTLLLDGEPLVKRAVKVGR